MNAVQSKLVNGCDVVWAEGTSLIIDHPLGFMVYVSGWRAGTRKTFKSALKLAERESN